MKYAAIFAHFQYKARSYHVLNSLNFVLLINKYTMKQAVTITIYRSDNSVDRSVSLWSLENKSLLSVKCYVGGGARDIQRFSFIK